MTILKKQCTLHTKSAVFFLLKLTLTVTEVKKKKKKKPILNIDALKLSGVSDQILHKGKYA